MVQAHTGLRVQEVLGLYRDEIDLTDRTIKVQQQLRRSANPTRIRLKRLPAAVRKIVIGDVLTAELVAYFDAHPPAGPWAFVDATGHMWTYERYRRSLAVAGAAVDVKVTTHSFRHFHASVLILANVNLLVIARRLGHASTAMAERTYGRILRPADDVTRAAIDGARPSA